MHADPCRDACNNFNKFNFHLDGINGKLSDIDYYDAAMQMVTEQKFPVETSAPAYFKRNKVISWLTNVLAPSDPRAFSIRDGFVGILGAVLEVVGGEQVNK